MIACHCCHLDLLCDFGGRILKTSEFEKEEEVSFKQEVKYSSLGLQYSLAEKLPIQCGV